MKTWKLAILVASGLLAAVAAGQAQEKMEPPKPGPEHEKLNYFVGNWHSEGEAKDGPWGPGGKMSGEAKCDWMPGGFFVVCHDEGTGPMGKMNGIGVMGYDTAGKAYTWNGFNSMGENEQARGTLEAKTWTYTNEGVLGGKPMKGRYTMVEKSPASYTFKFEGSSDGKDWTTLMEGTVTKK